MGNAAIAYLNLADNGLLTTISSQTASMPASNLQVEHVFRRWRSVGGYAFVVLDLLSAVSIDTVALMGMTMTTSGYVLLRISTTDSTGAAGDVINTGWVPVDTRYQSFVSLMSPAIGRYIRLDLFDASKTYVEAGRLFVGVRNAFSVNFSYGWSRGWQDRSIRNKTRGGQTQIWLDNSYRTLEAAFNFLTATERNSFVEEIDRVNGLNTDVLFITDVASSNLAQDSIWGLMTETTGIDQPYFDRYSKRYKIEERL